MYGMPLFFVLSGFVIHYNYAHLFATRPIGNAVAEFAWSRFARLYPLYIFMLLFAICVDTFAAYMLAKPSVALDVATYFLTLTQSWVYVLWDGRLMAVTLFGVAWSISTEAFFYVAYVGLVFALLLLVRPRNILALSVIYAIGVIIGLVLLISHVDSTTLFYRWLLYHSPYLRVFEFIMGCLAAQVFMRVRHVDISHLEAKLGNWLLAGSLAYLVIFGLIRMGFIVLQPINGMVNQLTLNFLFGPAFAAIMFYACRYETGFSRFLSLPALVALGEISYSVYLTHVFTLRLFIPPTPPALTLFWGFEAIVRILVGVTFTLIVSYGTYRLIEMPCRAWIRSKRIAAPSQARLRPVELH